jgi:fucose 4-O-acetylase-like acetyltransferase
LLRVVSLYLENDHDWLESLKNIYLVFLGNAQNGGNDAVWFLTCLFITNLFFYFYLKIAHKRWHVITFLFFMLLFSYIDSILLISRSIYLPWKVDVSLMAIFFFGSGYLFRPYIDIMFGVTHNKYAVCLLITLLFVMNWYSARLNIFVSGIEHVKFVSAIYGNFLLFFISAFTGIATFVLISKVITSRVVRYFGYNSLTVLGFHKIIIFFIGKFICPNKILMISNLVTTFATFLFLIPIIFIFNKYIFDYLRNDRKIPNSVRSNI